MTKSLEIWSSYLLYWEFMLEKKAEWSPHIFLFFFFVKWFWSEIKFWESHPSLKRTAVRKPVINQAQTTIPDPTRIFLLEPDPWYWAFLLKERITFSFRDAHLDNCLVFLWKTEVLQQKIFLDKYAWKHTYPAWPDSSTNAVPDLQLFVTVLAAWLIIIELFVDKLNV